MRILVGCDVCDQVAPSGGIEGPNLLVGRARATLPKDWYWVTVNWYGKQEERAACSKACAEEASRTMVDVLRSEQ